MWGLSFCISYKLPGNASTAVRCSWTMLWVANTTPQALMHSVSGCVTQSQASESSGSLLESKKKCDEPGKFSSSITRGERGGRCL